MAVFAVEFSHGLSLPFMELLVGKRWGQPREGLRAGREAGRQAEHGHYLAQTSVVLARRSPTEKLPTNMYKHTPRAKNNLVAVLAISAVVFARPRPAVHKALGGQARGQPREGLVPSLNAIAERPECKPERNGRRSENKERARKRAI